MVRGMAGGWGPVGGFELERPRAGAPFTQNAGRKILSHPEVRENMSPLLSSSSTMMYLTRIYIKLCRYLFQDPWIVFVF